MREAKNKCSMNEERSHFFLATTLNPMPLLETFYFFISLLLLFLIGFFPGHTSRLRPLDKCFRLGSKSEQIKDLGNWLEEFQPRGFTLL